MSTASDSHSPARGNGLPGVLSKARRGRNRKNTDANSTVSNGSDGSHGLRGKLEGVMDKLKSQDGSDEDDGESNGLSKLIPKGISSKRRRRKEERDAEQLAEEAARGRSVAERGTLNNNDGSNSPTAEGDGSSLITYESENEEPTAAPPPLSSHPSHSGYLTTSSPLIQATTLPESTQPELQLDGVPKAATFAFQSNRTAALQPSSTFKTDSLQSPSNGSSNGSSSPVGKLREAFNPRRAPSISPERKSLNSANNGLAAQKDGNAGGQAGRRGSVASRIGAIFPIKETILPSGLTTPERPRTAKAPKPIETNVRPQTPPAVENNAPVIVNTPPTPTEIGPPAGAQERITSSPVAANAAGSNVVTSPSGNMISHRRIRSGSATLGPSKLSNITSAPLTPTPENPATGPGTNPQGGFFSSVFSAAQNAATTLSTSIANTSLAPGQRNKSGPQEPKPINDVEVETPGETMEQDNEFEQKEPAVKTLGQGDLSLSHLGIDEPSSVGDTTVVSKFPDPQEQRGRSNSMNRQETFSNRSVVALIGDSTEAAAIANAEDVPSMVRPRSVYEPMLSGDQTPPNGSAIDGKVSVKRSGSIRSGLGEGTRRHRGSSAATGTTIGAAIVAANTSVAHPNANGSTPKLTGFAVASKKRNRDFHQLFRSVPEDDYLIEDYSCALQREILAHGRLYVSEGHLCFSSNIFGWVTTLVMSFDEIVSIEKRNTALLFKNGLMISTLHAKNIFASFTSRDSTYDLIVGIWKLGHPSLRSSLNGVRIDETGGGDKTERIDAPESQSGSGSEDESEDGEVYDEDDEDEDGMSFTQAGEGSISGSDIPEKIASRKPSALIMASNGLPAEKGKEISPISVGDFPGPATHVPTQCSDQDTHYDKILADDIIPAPLGKTYDLMFGPASVSWMAKWLTNELKCLDFQLEDKKGLSAENRVRTSTYIKPLGGSIGPKQTKCIVTENLDSIDLEKAVSVTISTQTPDVPSGNVFLTKTKYCLMWAEGNNTRLVINYTIEWSGKSWLKGPIEKGATDGQTQYAKDLITSLRAAVSSRRTVVAAGTKSKKKGRREKSRSAPGGLDGSSDSKKPAVKEDWGLFEPLHGPLGPIVDILKPLISGNMVYGLLVGLLVAAWFSFGYSGGIGSSKELGFFVGTPERIAAYEEMWRHEESELWTWLEERVGMDRVHQINSHKRSDQAKSIEEKLREERVSEREIDTAIKVTEEKLAALKHMVERQKKTKGKAGASLPLGSHQRSRSAAVDTDRSGNAPVVPNEEPIVSPDGA